MAYVWALLGFAAVFAVCSTIVSVLVEAAHKTLGMRTSGLDRMLRAYHGDAQSKEAAVFAKTMTLNPVEGPRPWFSRGPLGWILGVRQQRLSTLQFVEHLARTPKGEELGKQDVNSLRANLTAAAYEFERLGEAQSSFFEMRAKLISIAMGFVVAFALNLDAITLYRELARDQLLNARISAFASRPEFLQAMQAQAAPQNALANAASPALGEDGATWSMQQARNLNELGLPIGYAAFPWCRSELGGTFANDGDERCPWKINRVASTDKAHAHASGSWMKRNGRPLADLGVWLVGVLAAGGLLGLGAPFWFNLFAKLASFATPIRHLSEGTPAREPEAVESAGKPSGIRNKATVNPDALVRGFLISQGRVADAARNAADAPRGAYLGA